MNFLNQEQMGKRSLEMYAALEAITDPEVKAGAEEFVRKRIEDMRKSVTLMEDDEFFNDIIEIVEKYQAEWFEDGDVPEMFTEKLSLLKTMIQ